MSWSKDVLDVYSPILKVEDADEAEIIVSKFTMTLDLLVWNINN